VDEKSQIQALDRSAPVLPLMPGVPARQSHDYVRNGTTNLYAALDVASGQVLAEMTPRHRAEEFRRFLNLIDASVPAPLDVHVVLDNSSTHKTPSIQRWLVRQPRFTLHFTPTYSSWLNLVERWFAELTTKWIKRGCHRSVRDLVASIRTWITNWNDDPKPFVWHKSADEILDSLAAYRQRINDSDHEMAAATIARVRLRALALLTRFGPPAAGEAGLQRACASPRRPLTAATSSGERPPRRPRRTSPRPGTGDLLTATITADPCSTPCRTTWRTR